MAPDFLRLFQKQAPEAKIVICLVFIALAARLFALLFMPDATMTDSLYHLNIAKYIVQNHALPLAGIPGVSNASLPVPLYHIIVAIPFTVLGIPFSLEAARVFPFIFSMLQLALSCILLKKLFPKNWLIGFAFVAMQPLLIVYGALNYLETLASVTVLLCFLLWLEFVKTGKNACLLAMPLAIAAMALSKESATILVPIFFLAFLYELWKKKGKSIAAWAAKTAYFALTTAIFSSIWFIVNSKAQGTAVATASQGIDGFLTGLLALTPVLVFLVPLQFNASFWFFLAQGFESVPFGITAELAFVAFTIATFPVLCFLAYGLAKSAFAKHKPAILLLLCLIPAFGLLAIRANYQISSRVLVPLLPLFGIAACTAYGSLPSIKWKRIFLLFFSLTVLYSAGLTALYALNFHGDYASHVPLYGFIGTLPEGSAIAVHPNLTRQVEFITGRVAVSFAYFGNLGAEQLEQALEKKGVTHIAATCYKNPWGMGELAALEQEGFLEIVFEDDCSTLYKVKR